MRRIWGKFMVGVALCLAASLVFAGGAQADPPNPPGGLTAEAVSSSEIHLSWSDPGYEDWFKIYRNGILIDTTYANITNYEDKCLDHNTTYSYCVSAYNSDGESGCSNENDATTPLITTVCSSGCNQSSIQAAIDVSCDGDTIQVGDGTYYENINFNGKAITVQSVNGEENTTIDGSASGSVVTFKYDEGLDSVLDGFTITNGSGTDFSGGQTVGGGIFCWYSSSPTITNCTISDNSASFIGGGIFCSSSSLTITNCNITNNTGGGISCLESSLTITNCNITDNTDGGIACLKSSAMISDCIISGNRSDIMGGGLLFSDSSSPVINNCTISNNTASNMGGGIFCSSSSPTITNCNITDNTSEVGGGGGIYCQSSSLIISDCVISSNTAEFGSGGGLFVADSSPPVITDCIISNNSAFGEGGGIICFQSSPIITNCTISDNSASLSGGGIACSSSSPTITNCVISSNTAEVGMGGGLSFDVSPSPVITNCIISNNTASNMGGGIYCLDSSPTITNCTISGNSATETYSIGGGIACFESSPTVVNSILWEDTAVSSGNEIHLWSNSSISITYSDIQGGWEGEGNIDANPVFGANYHLTASSPCIDAGTSIGAPSDDIDGDTRPWGAGYDMGADEYTGTCIPPATPSNPSPTDGATEVSEYTNLDWADASGASSYDVYFDTISPPSFVENVDLSVYEPGNLNDDTHYYWKVVAKNDCGDTAGPEWDFITDDGGGGIICPHDGDVNQDGNITPQDALMAFQHYLGLTQLDDCQQSHADVNEDGSITPADALCIFQKYLGLESCLD